MATIIKRNSEFYPSGQRLTTMALDMAEVEGQAEQYIQGVRTHAVEIVKQANQEAESIKKKSESAGRQAAEAAVDKILDEKVAIQMQTLIPALQAAVKQIEDSRHDWLRTWETRTVKLACEISKRIIRRELKSEPELPLQWVREALELCGKSAEIVLKLNPTDYASLKSQVARLAKQLAPAADARIVADPDISIGGCKVETEYGSIDQQIETQLERISQELD